MHTRRHTQKTYSISLLVAVAIVVVLGLLFARNSSRSEVCVDNNNLCLTVSEEWNKEDLAAAGLDNYIHLRLEHKKTKGKFQITSLAGGGDVTSSAFKDEINKQLSSELKDHKQISAENKSIANSNAFVTEYLYTIEGDTAKQQKLILLPVNDRIYYVTILADPLTYEELESSADAIIKSLNIRS